MTCLPYHLFKAGDIIAPNYPSLDTYNTNFFYDAIPEGFVKVISMEGKNDGFYVKVFSSKHNRDMIFHQEKFTMYKYNLITEDISI